MLEKIKKKKNRLEEQGKIKETEWLISSRGDMIQNSRGTFCSRVDHCAIHKSG